LKTGSTIVVILQSAEQDLKELRSYIHKNFGKETWLDRYADIKATINNLKTFPNSGSTPDALEQLNLAQYRQVISGHNRIVYEVRQKTIYVHLVADTRRDMKSLLTRRLLRAVE